MVVNWGNQVKNSVFLIDILLLSAGLIMLIGHHEEIQKMMFRLLALCWSEFNSLQQRANTQNVSF